MEDKELITTDKQITGIEKKISKMFKEETPKEVIKLRKGAGGKMFPYVPIDYILKKLDDNFGIFWEFVIDEVRRTESQIIVRGKLVIKSPNGFSISRPGVGRASIKMYTGTKNSVDEGNDEKSATSDAIKKAASLFGIAADVYYKELQKYEDLDDDINEEEDKKAKVVARFFAIAKERGIEAEDAKSRIKKVWNVAHMEELTIEQMEKTIASIIAKYPVQQIEDSSPKISESKVETSSEFPALKFCRNTTRHGDKHVVLPAGNDPEYFCDKRCQDEYYDHIQTDEKKKKFEEFISKGKENQAKELKTDVV